MFASTAILALLTAAQSLAAPYPGVLPVERSPDFELGGSKLLRRQDYDQDYTTDSTVSYTPASDGYSVDFSGSADFVVGKGWKTGDKSRVISYDGKTTASAGTVLMAVYGWTTDPLVEYYVQEYSNGAGTAAGDNLGTYESDGNEYTIWKHTQVNQPSIQGTTTFTQYISVRSDANSGSGVVTFANHAAAWSKAGLELGTMNYQVLATEGWGSASGSASYTLTTGTASGSSSGNSTETADSQTGTSASAAPVASSSAVSAPGVASSSAAAPASTTTGAASNPWGWGNQAGGQSASAAAGAPSTGAAACRRKF